MEVFPDRECLLRLVRTRMPFGKYTGQFLLDLPESYVLWLKQEGFPEGELGESFGLLYEIKVNGLERLLAPLRPRHGDGDVP